MSDLNINSYAYDYADLHGLRGELRIVEDSEHLAIFFEEESGSMYLIDLLVKEPADE